MKEKELPKKEKKKKSGDLSYLRDDVNYCFQCGMWDCLDDLQCTKCGACMDDLDMDDIPGFRD